MASKNILRKTEGGKSGRRVSPAAAVAVAAAIAVFLCARAAALTPPLPGMIEQYRRDGTLDQRIDFAEKLGNDKMAPDLVAGMKYRMAKALGYPVPEMAPPSGRVGLPTGGSPFVLVLLIEFNEYPHSNEASEINSELFADGDSGDYPYESLRNYYLRSSYNLLEIRGSVVGWRNCGNRSSVPQTDSGREDLITATLRQYDSTVNYSIFDNDGDGEIDYFIVIWTGPHNGWSNFWWAYKTTFNGSDKFDGKSLGAYSWNPEYMYQPPATPGDFKPRVIIHETGHALGLPDYYDYDDTVGPDGGVGGLDMMDANWGDHNAFSKLVLGWTDNNFYISTSMNPVTVTLKDSITSRNQDNAIIMPGIDSGEIFTEYFIVENRNKVGNDSGHPGAGMLIWHVDAELNWLENDFANDNSYTDHKLLRLMEADGLEEIENNGGADAGDYYNNGEWFTPYTTPNSRKYDGTNKQIYIANVSAPGNSITFDLRIGAATAPPVKSNFSPAEGTTVAMAPDITLNTSVNAKCRWSLYDRSYSTMSSDCEGFGTKSHTCEATGLSGPEDKVYIACSDMFGTADTAVQNEELTYLVDDTFPTQSNWTPVTGSRITDPTPDIEFDVSENAWCRWSLEDLGYNEMGSSHECLYGGTTHLWCTVNESIPDGSTTIYTACRDQYYNKDTAATNIHLTYIFDGMPPAQSNWNPAKNATITTRTPILTLNTNEIASCRWSTFDQRYSHMVNTCDGAGSTSHSCYLSLGEGEVLFHVACMDSVGMEETADTNEDITYTIDSLPPGQGYWSPAKGSSLETSKPVITFQTGENASCRWSLSDLAYGAMSGNCSGDGTKNQSCSTSGLLDGAEIVYISCADTLGNQDTADSNEHVDYTISTTTPEPFGFDPAEESTINTTTPVVTFTTNKVSSCRWALTDLGYADMPPENDCSGGGTTSLTCEPTGLPEGIVTVYISCDDGLGHVDTADTNTEVVFTIDISAPVQSNWFPSKGAVFASSSVMLTFDTNEAASCRTSLTDVSYEGMKDTGNCITLATTTHICEVSGLAAGPAVVYTACKDTVLNRNYEDDNEHLDYTVDQSAPVQGNWDPPDGTILMATSTVLTLDTDEIAYCTWAWEDLAYGELTSSLCDGLPLGSTTQACNIENMTTGPVSIHVSCTDALFNSQDAAANKDLHYTVFMQEPTVSPVISSGWNLLGGSKTGASLDAESLFGDGFYAVVDYDGSFTWSAVAAAISLEHGGGFWLYSETDAGEVEAGGTDYTEDNFEIAGGPGWKIFSNPYKSEISWSDQKASLTCNSTTVDLPDIFYYTGLLGYVKVSANTGGVLRPWLGHWIYFPGNCTLTISK